MGGVGSSCPRAVSLNGSFNEGDWQISMSLPASPLCAPAGEPGSAAATALRMTGRGGGQRSLKKRGVAQPGNKTFVSRKLLSPNRIHPVCRVTCVGFQTGLFLSPSPSRPPSPGSRDKFL